MIESLAHAFDLTLNGLRIGDLWEIAKEDAAERTRGKTDE